MSEDSTNRLGGGEPPTPTAVDPETGVESYVPVTGGDGVDIDKARDKRLEWKVNIKDPSDPLSSE